MLTNRGGQGLLAFASWLTRDVRCILHCARLLPTTKKHLESNVNNTKVEQPCPRYLTSKKQTIGSVIPSGNLLLLCKISLMKARFVLKQQHYSYSKLYWVDTNPAVWQVYTHQWCTNFRLDRNDCKTIWRGKQCIQLLYQSQFKPLPFDKYEIIFLHWNLEFSLLKMLKYCARFSLKIFPHLNPFDFWICYIRQCRFWFGSGWGVVVSVSGTVTKVVHSTPAPAWSPVPNAGHYFQYKELN